MSLRVWLPLTDGTLKQQGLNGNIISSNNYSSNNNGKIGKCIQTNSTSSIPLGINGNIINSGSISFGGWFKFNKTEISNIISTGEYTSTYKTATGNVLGNDTYGGIALIWSTNDIYTSGAFSSMSIFATLRTSTVNNSTASITVEFDTWMHLFLIYDKNINKLSFYKNGILVGEKTFNTFSDAASREIVINYKAVYGGNARSYNIPFYANDVRIYDHALSPLEVKEISQGLVLHYPLNNNGWGNENLATNTTNVTSFSPSGTNNYCSPIGAFQTSTNGLNIVHNATTSDVFTLSFDYEITGCDTSYTLSPGFKYTSSSYQSATYISGNSITVPVGDSSGHFERSFNLTTGQISYGQGWLFGGIGNNNRNIVIKVKNFKFEQGSVATVWSPSPSDALYTQLGLNNNQVIDCSGYGNNGTKYGTITNSSSIDGRYQVSTYITSGNTDYIQTPTLTLPGDAITMNFWFKSSNKSPGSSYHMPLEAAASSNQAYEMSIHQTGYLRGGLVVAGTRKVDNCTSTKLTDGNWHMCTMTYDGTTIKRYVDTVMEKSTSVTGSLVTSTYFIIGHYGTNTSYYSKEMSISDVRIYVTALSEADIKALYNTSANIDNLGNFHSFKFIENGSKSISKTGITNTQELYELDITKKLKYDNTIYTEPDGSKWVHIVHHDNPNVNGYFSSSNDFANSVYIDANRWFNAEVCNYTNTWEFMFKQKTTSSATEETYRWVQYKNPFNAVYADVKRDQVVNITSSGGKTYNTSSVNGGVWKMNSSTYFVVANASSGNWFGALGAWSAYNSGIPGFPNTTVTTGYVDLYLRIPNASINDGGIVSANEFIEK